ncbi:MAG TPA: hypothetical protein ENI22_01385 [Candidatus Pacearchaeota archaeon]|nr:hypothetical protein [Candidatus Pacearchaeota archaeon]
MKGKKEGKRRRTLKKVFFTILLGFAIIAFWRGAWGLLDIYLFPNNYVLSLWISIFIGIFILYSTKNLIDRLA